jgi:MFS superfamily sulfate permease-like transporter
VTNCALRVDELFRTLIVDVPLSWTADWAWGMPLIVLTVLLHVLGLGLVKKKTLNAPGRSIRRHPDAVFVGAIGITTLLVTGLHAIEAGIWAAAYRLLGALPDNRSAMLYSLNAMTSYGHINISLEDRWQLMGAMEALNGWLLFGLSTAFLFAVIEKVAIDDKRREHDSA